ncbi:hypothetical protein [Parasphingorhabdus sp.]|uniref:hypothetical protein n=1 Tax=Parasphingorhabdus sp. TaxID=2709688 RepID=UPI003A8F1F9A
MLGAVLALGSVSCTTGPAGDSMETVFGMAPAGPDGTASAPAILGQQTRSLTIRDIVRASFEIAKDDLQPCLNADRRARLASLQPIKIIDAKKLHVLSVYEPQSRTITISELTWRNFAFAAMSEKLAEIDNRFDVEWRTRYRLFLRNKDAFDDVQSPVQMAGLPKGWIGAEVSSELVRHLMEEAQYNATFVLAHEYHHHLEPVARQTGESVSAFRQRLREHELAADRFAMDMMLCRSVIERSLDPMVEVPQLFFDWILMLEGKQHALSAETHPLDHHRARNAANYLIQKLQLLSPSPDRLEMIGVTRELVKVADDIDREGPSVFFGGINEEAKTVTRDSLRFR